MKEFTIMFNNSEGKSEYVRTKPENAFGGGRMSLVVKGGEPKTIELEDGLHKGKIESIEERPVVDQDYSYLDVFIQVEGVPDLELRVGYPMPKPKIGLNSKQELGKLVERFTKEEIEADKEYDLGALLVGKRVQFVSLVNEKGYVEVTKSSVKLLKEEEQ